MGGEDLRAATRAPLSALCAASVAGKRRESCASSICGKEGRGSAAVFRAPVSFDVVRPARPV